MKNAPNLLNFYVSRIPTNDLRNRGRFLCFHKVMVTQVEVWESENSCGKTSRFEFSQSFTSFLWKLGMKVSHFFYKINVWKIFCFHRLMVNGFQPSHRMRSIKWFSKLHKTGSSKVRAHLFGLGYILNKEYTEILCSKLLPNAKQ